MSNLLSIARSGLMASKKSLETTGHNIANVNTEGYSRQRVDLKTNSPLLKNGIIHGTGVKIKGVNRVHDQFLEKKLNKDISNHQYYDTRFQQLTQLENIFNELDSGGLNQVLNKFYNSFRDLSNQPENETVRSVVRDNAQLVTKDFNRIRGTLNELAETVDTQIVTDIEDINNVMDNIAYLNKKIAQLEATNGETGDLRDQRDLAVRSLSKHFKLHTYEGENGGFVVHAVNVGTLVTGTNTQHLTYGRANKEDSSNNMNGSVEIFFENRPTIKITNKFQSGEFASLIRTRNTDIRGLQKSIDRVAFEFVNSVNAVHRRGFVSRPIQADEHGNFQKHDNKGPTTGINFFNPLGEVEDAAAKIDLSDLVRNDLTNITTALRPNAPGDNRVALGISKLQHEKVMADGTATLEEFYLQKVGQLGLETGKSKFDTNQMEGILSQTQHLKDSTTGVSIDEEAANMVRYQHAYDAAAKIMQTANEMFDTVINIKR